MKETIKLPELAEGIEGGDIVAVTVSEGDIVTLDQTIIELETDKATVPVPTPHAGKIVKLHVKNGDRLAVGDPIADVETDAQSSGAGEAKAEPEKKKGPEPEKKKEPEPQAEKETERKPEREPQEEKEPAKKPAAAEKEQPVEERRKPKAEEPSTDDHGDGHGGANVPAGPAARRLARELGVDISAVSGSEKGGRITPEDVKDFVRERKAGATAPEKAAAAATGPAKYGPIHREPMSSLRRKIAENMQHAWTTVPHVHQFHSADITELTALQKKYALKFKERGVTLTMTSLILKACAATLKKYPNFNASLDTETGEIIFKDYVHIGVAVDTEAGLIVPVIRNVDEKDLFEISQELADVAARTRERKVSIEELRGASFTVSNLGGIGGGAFTPIINPPEVSVLGVGRGKREALYVEGELVPRMVLPLCLAYDHRVIDGADGARFVTELVRVLENYADAMLLGL
jgi:pyruvate dehydrogenase E2 component (dihydrolipoamide acetyltransferase)